MLIAPMLALALFAVYMSYVGFQQQSTQKELLNIQNKHFPILTIGSENIVLFDGVVKSFEDSVGAKEEAWLDKSLALKAAISKNLNQLKDMGEPKHQNILSSAEKSFLNYFDLSFELSKLLINDDKNLERIETLSKSMPTALKETRELFSSFKSEQQSSFTDAVKNINDKLREILITGAALGFFSFALILTVTMILSINTKSSISQLLKSVADIADGRPDFSNRIAQNSKDELGMLVEQFNRFTQKLEKDYTELAKAKQDVEYANKTKSEFLANMSHEIRTPINAIIGFSEIMEKTNITKEQSDYLRSIKTGSKALLSLINDILDLSKIEAGRLEIQPEPLNLRALIDEVCNIFKPNINEKGLVLKINISKDLPSSILLDETRIKQTLFNLIGNAIKFTQTGWIEVRAYSKESQKSALAISLFIEVEDTGIGIPIDQQRSIFESFKQQDGQSNRKYGGTGLGLSISLKLAQIMGGTLEVKSDSNVGSTFTLRLDETLICDERKELCCCEEKCDIQNGFAVGKMQESLYKIDDPNVVLLWENANKSGMFHDILPFCDALVQSSNQHNEKAVNEYVNSLRQSVANFDVESIEKLLKEFSQRINI